MSGLPISRLLDTLHHVTGTQPRRNGLLRHDEAIGGLGLRPSSGSLQLQDAHPLDRPVVRASSSGNTSEPQVLDRELLLQKRELAAKPINLGERAPTR